MSHQGGDLWIPWRGEDREGRRGRGVGGQPTHYPVLGRTPTLLACVGHCATVLRSVFTKRGGLEVK